MVIFNPIQTDHLGSLTTLYSKPPSSSSTMATRTTQSQAAISQGATSNDQKHAELSGFLKAVKAVAASTVLEDLIAITEDNMTLKQDNASSVRQISRLQVNLDKAERDSKEKDAKLREAQKECKDMSMKLGEAGKKLSQAEKRIVQVESDAERRFEAMKRKIAEEQAEVNRLSKFSVALTPIPENKKEINTKLNAIWTSAITLAEAFFSIDFHSSTLINGGDVSQWDRIKDHKAVRNIPFPLSNSPTAKLMRVAAFVALLFHELRTHIFQPTYFLRNGSELNEFLDTLADANPDLESHLRSVLLKASGWIPGTLHSVTQTCVLSVRKNVANAVIHLLPKPKQDLFLAQLEKLCVSACINWAYIQKLDGRVEFDFEVEEQDDDEEEEDGDDEPRWKPLVLKSIPTTTTTTANTTLTTVASNTSTTAATSNNSSSEPPAATAMPMTNTNSNSNNININNTNNNNSSSSSNNTTTTTTTTTNKLKKPLPPSIVLNGAPKKSSSFSSSSPSSSAAAGARPSSSHNSNTNNNNNPKTPTSPSAAGVPPVPPVVPPVPSMIDPVLSSLTTTQVIIPSAFYYDPSTADTPLLCAGYVLSASQVATALTEQRLLLASAPHRTAREKGRRSRTLSFAGPAAAAAVVVGGPNGGGGVESAQDVGREVRAFLNAAAASASAASAAAAAGTTYAAAGGGGGVGDGGGGTGGGGESSAVIS